MNGYLRQSTASQSRAIGPFLDDTDFKTAETALTIANTDIKLMANGGASANKNSGGGTHRANGVYGVTFDATDTATVGNLFVSVVVAGALPVFATFVVLEEAVYDALFAAAAPGFSTLDAAGIRTAVGLGSANLDTQLSTIDDFLDTEVAAIKAKTDNLPAAFPTNFASLAITATGAVGINWGNVENPSTVVQMLNTVIGTVVTTATVTNPVTVSNYTDIADGVWDDLFSAHTTPGTFGYNVGQLLDAAVSSRAATGDAMTLADGAITDAKITFPAETSGRATTFLAAMRRLWEWTTNKRIRNRATGAVTLRNAADSADLEEQTQITSGAVGSEIDEQSKGV